jgi:hypothetical protein
MHCSQNGAWFGTACKRWLVGCVFKVLLFPVPAYAMTWGTWNFSQSGVPVAEKWADGGSSSTGSMSTLILVPRGGSEGGGVPLNITFTNTVQPSFVGESISSSTLGLNNLTVTGGNVTISYLVSPFAGDISPQPPSNQFTGTGPSGTIAGKSGVTFSHDTGQRMVAVTFSFASGTSWTAVSPSQIQITFDH